MPEPWKTDKWYTSPWNHLPEVRKDFKFAKNIKIHDVTLRDGEQQTAVVFRREEKVAIAKRLDAMGVHRIEAGMPAVSEQDKAAISDIASLGLKADIFAFARCIPESQGGQASAVTGGSVEIPAAINAKNAYADVHARESATTDNSSKGSGSTRFSHDRRHAHELNRFLDRFQVARRKHGCAYDRGHAGCLPAWKRCTTSRQVIDRLKKRRDPLLRFGRCRETVAALAAGLGRHTTTPVW